MSIGLIEHETASSGQANELFSLIKDVTAQRGANDYTHHSYRAGIVRPPFEISQHFLDIDPTSSGVEHTIWLALTKRYRDRPIKPGEVASHVAFEQREHRDRDLTYFTRVGYWLVDNGQNELEWERHMTCQELGPHMKMNLGKLAGDLYKQKKPFNFRSIEEKYTEINTLEKELGLLRVTQPEAEVVVDFCRTL